MSMMLCISRPWWLRDRAPHPRLSGLLCWISEGKTQAPIIRLIGFDSGLPVVELAGSRFEDFLLVNPGRRLHPMTHNSQR